MNLTYGDLIVLEIALLQYIKNLDLSTQSGQYVSSLLGKLEYQMSKIAETSQKNIPLDPSAH